MISYSPNPAFVTRLIKIDDLSCITSCLVLPGFLVIFLTTLLVIFQMERKKIDEMKLGQSVLITLPSCVTSSMKGDNFTLTNENMEKLLEKRELDVRLSMVSNLLSSHSSKYTLLSRHSLKMPVSHRVTRRPKLLPANFH